MPIKEKYKNELIENQIAFEEGKHTEELIFNANEVIKSPGIPDKVELIKWPTLLLILKRLLIQDPSFCRRLRLTTSKNWQT